MSVSFKYYVLNLICTRPRVILVSLAHPDSLDLSALQVREVLKVRGDTVCPDLQVKEERKEKLENQVDLEYKDRKENQVFVLLQYNGFKSKEKKIKLAVSKQVANAFNLNTTM